MPSRVQNPCVELQRLCSRKSYARLSKSCNSLPEQATLENSLSLRFWIWSARYVEKKCVAKSWLLWKLRSSTSLATSGFIGLRAVVRVKNKQETSSKSAAKRLGKLFEIKPNRFGQDSNSTFFFGRNSKRTSSPKAKSVPCPGTKHLQSWPAQRGLIAAVRGDLPLHRIL